MSSDTPLVKRAYNLGLKAVPNFLVLSKEQIAYYEAHLDELPTAVARGFVISPTISSTKFILLADLGILTVPVDYEHATALASFRKRNHNKYAYYNNAITDENFDNPSRVLKSGDRIHVKAWKQVSPDSTTSEERMTFLATLPSHHTGAQGASLVLFDQMRDKLPKGYWYVSMDEKNRLWKGIGGLHRVPAVHASQYGDFHFDLCFFENTWKYRRALLSFGDE